MKLEKVEIKVQRDPWTAWEKLPVLFSTIFETIDDADQFAYDISLFMGNEVRWNYLGSTQGHYVNAKYVKEF